MAPIVVRYSVATIIVFLPSRSANIDNSISPVILPANYADNIESRTYLSSQQRCICAVIVCEKSILHSWMRAHASFYSTFVSAPQVNVGVTSKQLGKNTVKDTTIHFKQTNIAENIWNLFWLPTRYKYSAVCMVMYYN